jgi:putative transposase
LEIAPTTYWSAKTRPPCARAQRDAALGPKLEGLWERNYSVYGRRKLTARRRRLASTSAATRSLG